MNNNLEFENENPSPDSIEDNHPRTNYGEGYGGKETLEEAAETELRKQNWDTTITLPFNGGFIEGFQQGAEWQAERMYSEKEMIDFAFNTYCYISKIMNVPFNQISENKFHAIDNLEQFKKRNGK